MVTMSHSAPPISLTRLTQVRYLCVVYRISFCCNNRIGRETSAHAVTP